MIHLKQRNTAWLITLGLLIGFALLAAPIPPAIQFSLIGIFAVAIIASVFKIGPSHKSLTDLIGNALLERRITSQAREATERAASTAGYFRQGVVLLDIGLIAMQTGIEGVAMRRTRNISKDDDGVRPFATIHVENEEAERQAVVRFELHDQTGSQQYVHEMKTYLRKGENDLVEDHHLPLDGNHDISGSGEWDLRVYVDDNLLAMQSFMLSPSVRDRQRRNTEEYRGKLAERPQRNNLRNMQIVDEVEQPKQATLGDLLQQQQPSQRDRSSDHQK